MRGSRPKRILISGSTGYIGSRLIQALLSMPYEVCCTARNPKVLREKLPDHVTVIEADFSLDEDFSAIFNGVDVAFFLIHSLGESEGFEETEYKIAKQFSRAAKRAGVKRIVYLGGLVNEASDVLSKHMRSRLRVGELLRESGVEVIEFRASIILGVGSLSFELIRALVERLPVMILPTWVRVKAQPIFVDNVIDYLIQAIESQVTGSQVFEIGGQSVVSYKDLMQSYAKQRGLKRLYIPVPFLTPFLSSLWLGLVTPIYARIGRKLVESITVPTVVTQSSAQDVFSVPMLSVDEAMARCLNQEEDRLKGSRWSDAVSATSYDKPGTQPYGNRIVNVYSVDVTGMTHPFSKIERIGGEKGWYFLNSLWQLRGAIDVLFGGVGMRRGRPDPKVLHVGDTVDWWRVEAYEKGRFLRLIAEMKLPGRAWLEFSLIDREGRQELLQTVVYDPVGLLGILYWYSLVPIHIILFKGMLKRLVPSSRLVRRIL